MTLSNPPFFPWRARASKSSWGFPYRRAAARRVLSALLRNWRSDSETCSKELAGRDFLNSSKASSLFKTLIVSARATNSSARLFLIASYSCAFVLQVLANSAEYPSFSSNVVSVSRRSFFSVVIFTARSPCRSVFSSIAACAAPISLFLADTKPLKLATASFSVSVISASLFSISSFIVFKMPMISPDCGESAFPCRKATTLARSSSMMSAFCATFRIV
mmetsp:Transcript_24653/g.54198  ORF Transcript_24653/g.54198 Transcript_24653/m.54198 type:complete len:219 (+) Transcript_24653:1256-1912(+)